VAVRRATGTSRHAATTMASVKPSRRLVVSTWATVSRVQAMPRSNIWSASACWVRLALDLRAATLRLTMSSIPVDGSPFMTSRYHIVRNLNIMIEANGNSIACQVRLRSVAVIPNTMEV
jgi:hypothetical protein